MDAWLLTADDLKQIAEAWACQAEVDRPFVGQPGELGAFDLGVCVAHAWRGPEISCPWSALVADLAR